MMDARDTSPQDRELHVQVERYRRAIAQADAASYERDFRNDRYIHMGEAIERLTGYRPDEITPAILLTLIKKAEPRGAVAGMSAEEAIRRTLSGELRNWSSDFLLVGKDGRERWIADSSVILFDSDGVPIGSLGIMQDITARKNAEKFSAELTALGGRLSAVATIRDAAIAVVDSASHLLGLDMSMVIMYAEAGNVAFAAHVTDTVDGVRREFPDSYDRPLNPGPIFLRTLREGPQLLSREEAAPFSPQRFGDKTRHSESVLFAPLRDQQQKNIGIISIQSYTPGFYDQESMRVLRVLADYCSSAIARAKAQEALAESEQRYALAARGANDGLWDWDLRRNEIYLSARWKEILGHAEHELSNKPEEWLDRVHPEEREEHKQKLEAHLNGETEHFLVENRLRNSQDHYTWVVCRGVAVRVDGEAVRMAGSMMDISERRAAQDKLRRAAFYDSLTGLPNRALFLDRLERCLARGRRQPNFRYAVLFMDLDAFKQVNDEHGHFAGDRMLQQVAQRLLNGTREGDTVSRLGGDEFTIILEDLQDIEEAEHVAQRILEDWRHPFDLDGVKVEAGVSIGIALSTTPYERTQDILRDADIALYQAKQSGKQAYRVFEGKPVQ
ncbi:hypothetical protein BH09SUM1_BH09SUM1_07360 [soil metagenome]